MADMFGGPIGTDAYDQNQREGVKTNALALTSLAHARYYNAEAAEKEEKARQEGVMGQLMASGGGAPGGPGAAPGGAFSISDRFDFLARTAANSGLVTQAQTLAKTAAELRSKEASTLSAQTTARVNQIKEVKERSQLMGQLFGGATDEASWNRANALFTFQTGKESPFAGVPYSQELANSIQQQSLEMKERLDLAEKKLSREALADYRGARLSQHDASNSIAQERLKLEREREARLAKAGGKGTVGAATTEEVREVKRRMELANIDTKGIDAASLNSTAFTVASRARELQKENPALGRAQAIERAFIEAQENGDLATATTGQTEVLGMKFGGKTQFKRKEPTEKIELPPAAKSALKPGIETTFQNGQVWTLEGGKPKRVK